MADTLAFLSRDQIKNVNDIQYKTVQVDEWGGSVRVRSLTAKDREHYGEWVTVKKKEGRKERRETIVLGASAKLVILAAVDQDGQRIFTDADVDWLTEKNAAAVHRIAGVVIEMNGLAAEEELGNDSAPAQSEDSPSA